jgi:hypothetical protein
VTYIKCESEVHLLKEFLAFWERNVPDIVTGWNTEFFDIPYLCNRIKRVFDEDEVKRLSPWRNVFARQVYQMGRTHQIYTIDGICTGLLRPVSEVHILEPRTIHTWTISHMWNWVNVRMVIHLTLSVSGIPMIISHSSNTTSLTWNWLTN